MRRRVIIAGVAAACLLAALAVSILLPHRALGHLFGLSAWLHALGTRGWLLFTAAIFLVTLVGIVPGSLLGIAAGAIYGVALGFAASALGIAAGAILAFALSRSILRPLIASLLMRSHRLLALDGMLTQDRWRIVALLRVSPVMPFSLTSYALGLSGISARNYAIGTMASLPPLLGYVVLGTLGGTSLVAAGRGEALIHAGLFVLGGAATLALTIHLTRMLAGALRTA